MVLLIHHVHQQQFALWFPRPLAALGRWLENQGSTLVYGRRVVCAVSPSSRAQIRGRLGLRDPVHLAAPGMPPMPPEARRRARARAGTPRIVCVGRLARQKCWDHLVRALPSVRCAFPGLEVHFVGDGETAGSSSDSPPPWASTTWSSSTAGCPIPGETRCWPRRG
ncbi:hypothetical protein [Streptomyces sp. CB03234]|uniref:hypothetical protein n=1 Tax=Streptomyces sp. (strain CB03234) TaxID=1703937 RepID=UPI001301350B|nr:hypothetical protein [Streptomyces sp. CB03234]